MEVADALGALGGTARWRELRGHVSWRAILRARSAEEVQHVGGTWSLVGSGRASVAAVGLRGVRSHRTAAGHWGFALPPGDPRHDITVPRKARRARVPDDVHLRYRDYRPEQLTGGVTCPVDTVVECLRDLPLRDALSIGDSALRSGVVDHAELSRAVDALRGPGSAVAWSRFAMLDARAANAFESSARAIVIEAGITGFEPQVTIRHRKRWIGRVDLADTRRRIVIECDGFEYHGERGAFVRDLVRFTLLVAAGWRPLRFTLEQVMFQPDWVLERVLDTIGLDPGARTTAKRPRRPVSSAA